MTKVIDLAKHRQIGRKNFLKLNNIKIDQFVSSFMMRHINLSLETVLDEYSQKLRIENSHTWDYQELRDVIIASLDEIVGEELQKTLRQEKWYDPRFISIEHILERCVACLVLEEKKQESSRTHLKVL